MNKRKIDHRESETTEKEADTFKTCTLSEGGAKIDTLLFKLQTLGVVYHVWPLVCVCHYH